MPCYLGLYVAVLDLGLYIIVLDLGFDNLSRRASGAVTDIPIGV